MAAGRATLRLLAGLRIEIDSRIDPVLRDLIRAWSTAWDEVAQEWQDALDELAAASVDGKWPPPAVIRRAKRASKAFQVTRERLETLAAQAGVTINATIPGLVIYGADTEDRLMRSQMPESAGAAAVAQVLFSRVDQLVLDAIVERIQGQITSTTKPLSEEALAATKATLVRGIAVGDNPRYAAAEMLRRVEGRFNGGLARALTIARTEMLDAHRAGAAAHDAANADVLAGWQWSSALDTRTCPSCWAMHGTVHELTEGGPDDHQNGRCARLPLTKPWKDLGIAIEEPPSLLPDAQATFDALSPAEQLKVMGQVRLDRLTSGDIAWSDLSTKRSTSGWRDSYGVTPLKDLGSGSS